MAYEDLVDRVRALIGTDRVVREQRMFGGLAFLIGGNMALAVSGQSELLVRVDPDDIDELVADNTGAEVATMGTRQMRGWVEIGPDSLSTDDALAAWVRRGVASAATLPVK